MAAIKTNGGQALISTVSRIHGTERPSARRLFPLVCFSADAFHFDPVRSCDTGGKLTEWERDLEERGWEKGGEG